MLQSTKIVTLKTKHEQCGIFAKAMIKSHMVQQSGQL